ncbi:MAG: biotin-dependent carboxyltransferase family protein [Pseudomonadota bacterium]
MTAVVLKAGIQTTVQAGPRRGHRHWGMPWSGAADQLSCVLANRAVGNTVHASALEISYGLFSLQFLESTLLCLMGAPARATINDTAIPYGRPIEVSSKDTLVLGATDVGVRTYLAILGGFAASTIMGSQSTYLPAALGGCDGRALQEGDRLYAGVDRSDQNPIPIPVKHHVSIQTHWRLRLHAAPGIARGSTNHQRLFNEPFTATRRANRMGIQIEGPQIDGMETPHMESVPVFPGTVQYPPDGKPFLLMCDAQTTGGYPRIGQVARVDRYKLGQIRPGNTVQFLEVSPQTANRALAAKRDMLKELQADSVFD